MEIAATKRPSTEGQLLGELSALAGRGFASTEDELTEILTFITSQLGIRTAYLTNIDRDACRLRVVAAVNKPGGSDVSPGDLDLLDAL